MERGLKGVSLNRVGWISVLPSLEKRPTLAGYGPLHPLSGRTRWP